MRANTGHSIVYSQLRPLPASALVACHQPAARHPVATITTSVWNITARRENQRVLTRVAYAESDPAAGLSADDLAGAPTTALKRCVIFRSATNPQNGTVPASKTRPICHRATPSFRVSWKATNR